MLPAPVSLARGEGEETRMWRRSLRYEPQRVVVQAAGPAASALHSLHCPQVAPVLKERMVKKGSMMIGYQPHGDRANFFRMVVANPILTQADIDFLLGELERLGRDL